MPCFLRVSTLPSLFELNRSFEIFDRCPELQALEFDIFTPLPITEETCLLIY